MRRLATGVLRRLHGRGGMRCELWSRALSLRQGSNNTGEKGWVIGDQELTIRWCLPDALLEWRRARRVRGRRLQFVARHRARRASLRALWLRRWGCASQRGPRTARWQRFSEQGNRARGCAGRASPPAANPPAVMPAASAWERWSRCKTATLAERSASTLAAGFVLCEVCPPSLHRPPRSPLSSTPPARRRLRAWLLRPASPARG